MPEPIVLKETLNIRSRPDVLFRLVNDPKRRPNWDKNIRSMAYQGEERLAQGATVKLQLVWRLGGVSLLAKYNYFQAPTRATLEGIKVPSILQSFNQQWTFKPMPGGTEVTSVLTVEPRFGFTKTIIERMMRIYLYDTLMALQRKVDSNTADAMVESAKEMAEQAKKDKKDKKKSKK